MQVRVLPREIIRGASAARDQQGRSGACEGLSRRRSRAMPRSYPLPHQIEPLNRCLADFNHHYSHQRPHQAFGGHTPWQYLHDTAA